MSAVFALPGFLNARVKTKPTVLIARAADGNARTDVVLQLDHLALRLSHVRGEGNEDVSGDPLLDRDARSGILL